MIPVAQIFVNNVNANAASPAASVNSSPAVMYPIYSHVELRVLMTDIAVNDFNWYTRAYDQRYTTDQV